MGGWLRLVGIAKYCLVAELYFADVRCCGCRLPTALPASPPATPRTPRTPDARSSGIDPARRRDARRGTLPTASRLRNHLPNATAYVRHRGRGPRAQVP